METVAKTEIDAQPLKAAPKSEAKKKPIRIATTSQQQAQNSAQQTGGQASEQHDQDQQGGGQQLVHIAPNQIQIQTLEGVQGRHHSPSLNTLS